MTTTADEDNGSADPMLGTGTSLREAIAFTNANASGNPGAILYNLPASQQSGGVWTIQLGGALPQFFQSVLVSGPGADRLAVRRDTGGDYRILDITFAGLQISLSGLSIENGRVNGDGGDIRSFSRSPTARWCLTRRPALPLAAAWIWRETKSCLWAGMGWALCA